MIRILLLWGEGETRHASCGAILRQITASKGSKGCRAFLPSNNPAVFPPPPFTCVVSPSALRDVRWWCTHCWPAY